jgi:transposase
MLTLSSNIKVYLALGITDMRKSVNGLSIMVSEHIGEDPLSGHLFVFCNRRKRYPGRRTCCLQIVTRADSANS